MKNWIVKVLVLTLAGMVTYHFIGSHFEGGFPWSIYAALGLGAWVLEYARDVIEEWMKVQKEVRK